MFNLSKYSSVLKGTQNDKIYVEIAIVVVIEYNKKSNSEAQ